MAIIPMYTLLASQAVLPPHLRMAKSECTEFDLAVLILRALVQSGFLPRTVAEIEVSGCTFALPIVSASFLSETVSASG